MDDTEKKSTADIKNERTAAKIRNIQDACEIVGIPYDKSFESVVKKRSELYAKAKRLKPHFNPKKRIVSSKPKNICADEAFIAEAPPLRHRNLFLLNNKFILNDEPDIKVVVMMSEGFTYEDKDDDGKKKQIPEIVVTFKRSYDPGGMGMSQITQQMMAGLRPVTKSASSVIYNGISKKTDYPATFEDAIKNIESNYNARLKEKFGFSVDFSALKDSRFCELFNRAIMGSRLLTTVFET